jgi:hypothetical protein
MSKYFSYVLVFVLLVTMLSTVVLLDPTGTGYLALDRGYKITGILNTHDDSVASLPRVPASILSIVEFLNEESRAFKSGGLLLIVLVLSSFQTNFQAKSNFLTTDNIFVFKPSHLLTLSFLSTFLI